MVFYRILGSAISCIFPSSGLRLLGIAPPTSDMYDDSNDLSDINSFENLLLKEIDQSIFQKIAQEKQLSETLLSSLKSFFEKFTERFSAKPKA